MRFISFSLGTDAERRLGVLIDETTVLDLVPALANTVPVPSDLRDYITAGPGLHRAVAQAVEAGGSWPAELCRQISDVVLHAPLRPAKLVGVGLNYIEHVEESSRSLDTDKDLPSRPVLFSAPGTAVVGPDEPIWHDSAMTAQLDWECELAVVIGQVCKSVGESEALDHVFGYSIVNDISARDQRRSGQWFFSKGQDSYKPFGPMVVTADEIGDPHALQLSLTVNGDQRQNGNTAQMLFKIPQLIADISSGVTLEPGDVIATGSPQGVGAAMDPPTFLVPGDVVAATIEKIGTLSNPVKAV
ncbi:FAA hydrolase family protein [Mycolicibacterium sp. CH28]|uniref:fumarylacetoacetate hydrolase family protein n=1 Tax=Mycolicibacterium sp. CH28 TaxID=2512237 RepID=UPI001080DD43|nr:fumarylacetoacetate hydrolase family protein [Mycolicibacterium sp. CH28]TGD87873.1 FAA hydrolase family protein [Mycolicibacterium sp. CH28]